jgi:hypothetical protein
MKSSGAKPVRGLAHSVAAVLDAVIDELGKAVAAVTPALVASYAQHIELADQVTEDDCAVAGH